MYGGVLTTDQMYERDIRMFDIAKVGAKPKPKVKKPAKPHIYIMEGKLRVNNIGLVPPKKYQYNSVDIRALNC